MQSGFEYLGRGFEATAVLIPGWATDYRIFSGLELQGYNYLLPVDCSLAGFNRQLREEMRRRRLDRVALFGWSMGGFLAADFAARHPARVSELIVLSIRKRFDPAVLGTIESAVRRSRTAYLHEFYAACFSNNDREGRERFQNTLLETYLAEIKLEDLLAGLAYLSTARINPEELGNAEKLTLVHGEDDAIVPFAEAQAIKSRLPRAAFICLPGAGHLVFLNPRFNEIFNDL